ncbi:hypothetical protein ADK76_37010 [Streptomyces griseoflavus]|uniref:hypothetical protein n=1 Tax=Streptomyces rimosus TaxID=1927 RepID=UPI0004CA8545|nr:hypothetical protein [Streptomyces rimosus]KOG51293.1 hypothetical protein ADK76_37010 [Streptomyces griseoflavus]
MARRAGCPAHVHGEAVRKALLEARPEGLSLAQLCRATKRSPAQVWAGLRYLRKVAAEEGLPPVTYIRSKGFQLSDDAEVWVAYERALFNTELNRITNAISGIVSPHAKKAPGDEWVRLVLEQLSGVKATLEVLTRMER